MKLKTIKIKCEIEVPYWAYNTKKKNSIASKYITKWVRETLKHDCSFIPLYVERDETGAYIEDSSKKTKIRVKQK